VEDEDEDYEDEEATEGMSTEVDNESVHRPLQERLGVVQDNLEEFPLGGGRNLHAQPEQNPGQEQQ